jgi:beta-galactosidase/beta-glucuronidase
MSAERGYPRPLLVREHWESLNGEWDFHLDPDATVKSPRAVPWRTRINVPFAPETPASGVEHTDFFRVCWYRRSLPKMSVGENERVILHFGAVDYSCRVWLGDAFVGEHRGGYTPFQFDITEHLGKEQALIVRVDDDPHDLAKPRGKQDWQREPHSIWYPRTSGIWQTVWLERVRDVRIGRLQWTPNLLRWEIGLEMWLAGDRNHEGLRLETTLTSGGQVLAQDSYLIVSHEVHRRIALSDPGIDDSRNALLWSPESPVLIEAELRLVGPGGEVLDSVRSYTALRQISVERDRVMLNGRPYNMRLVLDQGYWPESGMTAPDDLALRRDVELAKAMGFNGVRKHQKIEDPRYLYWADHLGLLLWEEMPSAYRFTERAVDRVITEWMEVIKRDASHPCIIAWVPINESWGVPNLPHNPVEQHYVRALYHLTKTFDPTRLVIGNDGWESVSTDLIGIHDYDADTARIAHRYEADQLLPRLLKQERPGGRLLLLGDPAQADHPIVLSEFGGIALGGKETWGYSRCNSPAELQKQYQALLDVVRALGMLTGFCYTQFADTYQEANGLLREDRTPKFPLDEIRKATLGPGADFAIPPEDDSSF